MKTDMEHEEQSCSFLVMDKRTNRFVTQISLFLAADDEAVPGILEVAAREIEKSEQVEREYQELIPVPARNRLS